MSTRSYFPRPCKNKRITKERKDRSSYKILWRLTEMFSRDKILLNLNSTLMLMILSLKNNLKLLQRQRSWHSIFQSRFNLMSNSDLLKIGLLIRKFTMSMRFFRVFFARDGERWLLSKFKLNFQSIFRKMILSIPTDLTTMFFRMWSTIISSVIATGKRK